MTRKSHLLFCDNEHGTGDVTFPDVKAVSGDDLQRHFIEPHTIRTLRAAAKESGWGRVGGADYCPSCLETMSE